jgi:hypothetical protein
MSTGGSLSLGDLFGPLKTAFGFLKRFLTASATEKRAFFDNYIEPTFTLVGVIHSDYTQAFTGALERLQTNTDLQEVVRVLQLQRPRALAERQDVKTFLAELIDSRQAAWKSDELNEAFYEYVRSIEAYLHAASPLSPGDTWYTAFIAELSSLVRDGKRLQGNGFTSIAGGEHRAVQNAVEQLQIAVQQSMPNKRNDVAKAYAALKTLCTS